ncbi:Uncharacterised protein [Mycobacteroides abscessus subsp. abscessus]|uniref:hypothetical protein n=1 Tax=Mycobacteroides abscessus TaxID=36809 RepID=UPI000928DC4A|nr:hypothetical protein [Mycobacteroides abscessus]SHT43343.1 Uncharacterised protein [Mycobacteroides abscessus subsp. abscessus]SLK74778.1 Uncharacterised protein [Mycobacteroides abscessus subsp. abscessus]
MAAPTASDLTTFVGKAVPEDEAEAFAAHAEAVIAIVSAHAKSYTRGRGWDANGEPADDLRAVILTASARLLTNTSQITSDRQMGPFSVSYRPNDGWTTMELYVLNRYRERAR